jgi:type I restriction enzyme S subunit
MKSEWQTKTLGNVCRFIDYRGRTPEKTDRGLRLITAKNVKMGFLQKEPFEYVKPDSYDGWMTRGIPQKGDVLFTTEAPLANVAQLDTDEKVVFAQRIIILQPKGHDLNRTFLKYLILSEAAQNRIREKGTGATVQGIKASLLKTIEISFPPLPEQQRIVTILDEAFEGIATAKTNAEKNFQNARALFERHLQSVFTQRSEGWVEKRLGDLCEFENGDSGKNYPNRNEYVESGIPWINTGHIQRDGTLSQSEMNFISPEKYKSLRSGKIQLGDLVYCLRGATLGKTALVDPFQIGAVASSLVIIRPSALLDGRFLYSFLTSPLGQGLIKGYENGAAQPNLGAKSVAKYPISLPPLAEQKIIVQKFAAIAAETQRLESIYQQKLAALDALKKSLLHQTFTGAL